MENLQWRLLPLWNEERLAEALEDMEMAGQQAQAMKFRQARSRRMSGGNGGSSTFKVIPGMIPMGTGQAMQCELTQLWTPVETPSSSLEKGRQRSGGDMMAMREQEFLLSSPRSCGGKEPFPLYTEPIWGGGD